MRKCFTMIMFSTKLYKHKVDFTVIFTIYYWRINNLSVRVFEMTVWWDNRWVFILKTESFVYHWLHANDVTCFPQLLKHTSFSVLLIQLFWVKHKHTTSMLWPSRAKINTVLHLNFKPQNELFLTVLEKGPGPFKLKNFSHKEPAFANILLKKYSWKIHIEEIIKQATKCRKFDNQDTECPSRK